MITIPGISSVFQYIQTMCKSVYMQQWLQMVIYLQPKWPLQHPSTPDRLGCRVYALRSIRCCSMSSYSVVLCMFVTTILIATNCLDLNPHRSHFQYQRFRRFVSKAGSFGYIWIIAGLHGDYPLVMTNIAMENDHFLWENSPFLWPCSMAMLVITRGYSFW